MRTWHNFADRLDPVALDATLANDFKPQVTAHGAVRIIDHRIVNERTVSLRQFNPHSSFGYLSHPDVRKVVHHQIGFDSFGRFLVARDVAEEFVAPQRRVPVLIEVLEPGYEAVDESPNECKSRESEQPKEQQSLVGRIADLKDRVVEIAVGRAWEAGATDEEAADLPRKLGAIALRKYVSAWLTPDEINSVAEAHRDLSNCSITPRGPRSVKGQRAAAFEVTGLSYEVAATGGGPCFARDRIT